MKTIVEETAGVVNIGKIVFWVDSTAVYHWVRNDRNRYVPLIANRLAEVHNVFNELQQFQPEVWYIRTTYNAADLLTRVRTVDKFKQQFNFWITVLLSSPKEKTAGRRHQKSRRTRKKQNCERSLSVKATVPDGDEASGANSAAEYAKKTGHSDATAEQLKVIELDIVRKAQAAVFVKEIAELKSLPKRTESDVLPSKIFNSGPLRRKEVFLDEKEMLRIITRLDNADFVSTDKKQQLVLLLRHPLTQLLIREYHSQAGLIGKKITFVLMARRYSLPLSAVAYVVYKCQHCQERTPIPVKYPQAAYTPTNYRCLRDHRDGPVWAL